MQKITEVNCETGVQVERDMTTEELALHEEMLDLADAKAAEETSAQDARQSALAKLAALGLTEAEIAALLA